MLKHQARILDQAQFARAAAHTRMTLLATEAERLQALRSKLRQTPSPQSRLQAWSIQQASLRSDWFKKQELRTEASLREATSALKEREHMLLQARRELRKFELLRERQRREWHAHALRLEHKELDWMGSRLRWAAQIADDPGNLVPTHSGSSD